MREELEAAIDEDPDDPRSFAVYADWLIEHGDPVGELIARQLAIDAGRFERPAWILRYPPALHDALDRLAATDPDAEHTATQLTRKDLPAPVEIQRQLEALRALPANTARTQQIARLEAQLVTPQAPSPARIEVLAQGVDRRARANMLERFQPTSDADRIAEVLDRCTWRNGVIRAIELPPELRGKDRHLARLLAHAASRFLVELRLGGSEPSSQASIDALAARARPALRELRLGWATTRDVPLGNLEPLWTAVPRLERLSITGSAVTLGVLDLPRLRVLEHLTSFAAADELGPLAEAELPALERFKLRAGQLPRAELRRILSTMQLPSLHALALRETDEIDGFVEDLATLPLVRQLRTLDLGDTDMTDAGGLAIVRNRAAFAHLTKLDLSRNRLRGPVVAALQTLGPHVYAPIF